MEGTGGKLVGEAGLLCCLTCPLCLPPSHCASGPVSPMPLGAFLRKYRRRKSVGWAWSCCGFQAMLGICYLFQSSRKKIPLTHCNRLVGVTGASRPSSLGVFSLARVAVYSHLLSAATWRRGPLHPWCSGPSPLPVRSALTSVPFSMDPGTHFPRG